MPGGIDTAALSGLCETLRRPLDAMPDPLPLAPLPGAFDVSLRPPGSKSLTNRALALGSLATGATFLRRPLLSAEDAQVMIEGLRRFGARIGTVQDAYEGELLRIDGVAGRPTSAGSLNLANAGTAVRFLSTIAGLARGETIIDGSARMRQRPIGGLVAVLRAMRVGAEFLGEYGFPPVRIAPPADGGPLAGGTLRLPPQASSQFISALLMIAPWTLEGISIELGEPPVSASYLRMTLELLRRLRASNVAASDDLMSMLVAPGPLQAFDLDIEPDASGATYLWAAAALTPGARCAITGIGAESLQGDAAFAGVLARAGARVEVGDEFTTVRAPTNGALAGVTEDFSDMPDAAMTLAAAACFAEGPTTIRGLGTLPIKECDRLAATVTELRKVGADVRATEDSLTLKPPTGQALADAEPVVFDTYHDHRMAMSLALVGLRRANVAVADPGCVAKTYPTFWRDLARLYESAMDRPACPGGAGG